MDPNEEQESAERTDEQPSEDPSDLSTESYLQYYDEEPAAEVTGTEGEPEPEPEPEAPTTDDPKPFAPSVPGRFAMSEAERAAFNERLFADSDPAALIEATVNRAVTEHLRQNSIGDIAAGTYIAEVKQRAPELFAVHGAAINQALQMLEPQQRGTKAGVNWAITKVLADDVAQTGDIVDTIGRFSRLASDQPAGQRRATPIPAAPKPATPPAGRTPSPSGGGARSNPAPRAPQAARAGDPVEAMARLMGLTREQAKNFAEDNAR